MKKIYFKNLKFKEIVAVFSAICKTIISSLTTYFIMLVVIAMLNNTYEVNFVINSISSYILFIGLMLYNYIKSIRQMGFKW